MLSGDEETGAHTAPRAMIARTSSFGFGIIPYHRIPPTLCKIPNFLKGSIYFRLRRPEERKMKGRPAGWTQAEFGAAATLQIIN